MGMPAAHLVDGCAGQKLGMVKATPALLCCVHGHSDNEHLPRSCLGPGKHFQAVSQEHAQPAGDSLHPLVLEQVNQRPELTMVAAEGDRFDKSRRSQAAGLAEDVRYGIRVVGRRQGGEVGDAQVFPTTSTEGSWLWRKLCAAEVANWDTGQTQERAAAKGAGGGEQCTAEAVRGTSKHADHSPPNRSLRQRDVESQGNALTRKDAPHSRPASSRSFAAAPLPLNVQSIRGRQARAPVPAYATFLAGSGCTTRLPAMVDATPASTNAAPAYCTGVGRSCASSEPSNKAMTGFTYA